MAKEYKDLIVGLDIGTAKVMAVVAEVLPGGELAGLGVRPATGSSAAWWSTSTPPCKHPAGAEGGRADGRLQDQRVYTGITGSHIRGFNSSGMVAIKDKEVTPPTWRA
jgi:cell division protein FtsA